MTSMRKHERGEGKIGCVVSLLLLAAASALVIKVVPVLYSNNSLASAAEDIGSRTGLISEASNEIRVKAISDQIRAKAVDLEIPEILQKGAIRVEVFGDHNAGTCNIKLKYARKIDLYGIYTWTLETDKTISRPYMDAR